MTIQVKTNAKRHIVDITDLIASNIHPKLTGIVSVSVLHTTAAITTADMDPGTDLDLIDALGDLIGHHRWRHPHDPEHAPDHLLASIIGPSVTIPVTDGELRLGTWQRIVLIELDGPRVRDVEVTALAVR